MTIAAVGRMTFRYYLGARAPHPGCLSGVAWWEREEGPLEAKSEAIRLPRFWLSLLACKPAFPSLQLLLRPSQSVQPNSLEGLQVMIGGRQLFTQVYPWILVVVVIVCRHRFIFLCVRSTFLFFQHVSTLCCCCPATLCWHSRYDIDSESTYYMLPPQNLQPHHSGESPTRPTGARGNCKKPANLSVTILFVLGIALLCREPSHVPRVKYPTQHVAAKEQEHDTYAFQF